jgi:YggT family protein
VLRRGGNPQNAGWWLIGVALVGGILLLSVAQWLVSQAGHLNAAAAAGPRGVLRLIVYYASQVVLLALIARVIGSWVGIGRYNRWMRPAYLLTDWIVQPLKRVIPPLGMIDVTPIVAWLLLLLLRGWLLAVI